MSEDEEVQKIIKSSKNIVGYIYPVLVNAKTGDVIDGYHRLRADPAWPTQKVEVKDEKHEILLRIHAHHRRQVSQKEIDYWLIQLANELEKEGVQRGEIVGEIARLTGYSEDRVRKALPARYKEQQKSEAAKTKALLRKTQEYNQKMQGAEEEKPPAKKKSEKPVLECPVCGSRLELRDGQLIWIH